METIGWIIVVLADNFFKAYQYAWFIFLPILIIILVLIIINMKMKKVFAINQMRRVVVIILICVLITLILVGVATIRIWGPEMYKTIIKHDISGKQDIIEERLEAEYNRNFTFVFESEILMTLDAGYILGQDVTTDYEVIYTFKDDDGVPARVLYKKGYSRVDYDRERYEAEQEIYNYAKSINFDNDFYVAVHYCGYPNKKIDSESNKNEDYCEVYFILPTKADENKEFIISALKNIYPSNKKIIVYEYIVDKNDYQKIVSTFKSPKYEYTDHIKTLNILNYYHIFYYDYYYFS